jgi:hypothetical protein
MTKIILGLTLSLSFASAAMATEYRRTETTCAELQTALQEEGEVTVRYAISHNTYYADQDSCPAGFHGTPAFEGVNGSLCRVGFICKKNLRGEHFYPRSN